MYRNAIYIEMTRYVSLKSDRDIFVFQIPVTDELLIDYMSIPHDEFDEKYKIKKTDVKLVCD